MQRPCSLFTADDGQDLIEYALLASFIAIAVLGAVLAAGQSIGGLWQSVAAKMPSGS